MIDDLRPELEPYGAADMVTPHINRLAARGITFRNHYVQQSLCSPSRTSFLTGKYPEQTRVFDLRHYWRDVPETNFTTLPQAFKDRGYQTHGGGKTFHSGPAGGENDALWSWNTPYYEPPSDNVAPWSLRTPNSWYAVDQPEALFPDMQTAVDGMAAMGAAARAGRPSFTAVGIRKPHLPFIFPLMYLGNLPNDTNTGKPWQRTSNSSFWPAGAPTVAGNSWGEISKYPDVTAVVTGSLPWDPAAVFPASKQVELRRAYMAAVQLADSCVGALLDYLDDSGLSANTSIALWGDHGWKLGDHRSWTKHTNFELDVRSPLIIANPEFPTVGGTRTTALVDSVDVFPTLLDFAGLPMTPGLDGVSLLPLFRNTSLRGRVAAWSLYPSSNTKGTGSGVFGAGYSMPDEMGFSIRTDEWRYTSYVPYTFRREGALPNASAAAWPGGQAAWGARVAAYTELYDHRGDDGSNPEAWENANVAGNPAHAALLASLAALQQAGPLALRPAWAPPAHVGPSWETPATPSAAPTPPPPGTSPSPSPAPRMFVVKSRLLTWLEAADFQPRPDEDAGGGTWWWDSRSNNPQPLATAGGDWVVTAGAPYRALLGGQPGVVLGAGGSLDRIETNFTNFTGSSIFGNSVWSVEAWVMPLGAPAASNPLLTWAGSPGAALVEQPNCTGAWVGLGSSPTAGAAGFGCTAASLAWGNVSGTVAAGAGRAPTPGRWAHLTWSFSGSSSSSPWATLATINGVAAAAGSPRYLLIARASNLVLGTPPAPYAGPVASLAIGSLRLHDGQMSAGDALANYNLDAGKYAGALPTESPSSTPGAASATQTRAPPSASASAVPPSASPSPGVLCAAPPAAPAPPGAGSLLALRIGDGLAALGAAATTREAFVDELDAATGARLQSWPLGCTVVQGTAASWSAISRTADGGAVLVPCWLAPPGVTLAAATTSKAVFRLGAGGALAQHATWAAGGTGSIRAVAALNASGKLWWTGSSGLYLASAGDGAGAPQRQVFAAALTSLALHDGGLAVVSTAAPASVQLFAGTPASLSPATPAPATLFGTNATWLTLVSQDANTLWGGDALGLLHRVQRDAATGAWAPSAGYPLAATFVNAAGATQAAGRVAGMAGFVDPASGAYTLVFTTALPGGGGGGGNHVVRFDTATRAFAALAQACAYTEWRSLALAPGAGAAPASASATGSMTPTSTQTATASGSPASSVTPSSSGTASGTASGSSTSSVSGTLSSSGTASGTASGSSTSSVSGTPSSSGTASSTSSVTGTLSSSGTGSPSATGSSAGTKTGTSARSATATATKTAPVTTRTRSPATLSKSATRSKTASRTRTRTRTASRTRSSSASRKKKLQVL